MEKSHWISRFSKIIRDKKTMHPNIKRKLSYSLFTDGSTVV